MQNIHCSFYFDDLNTTRKKLFEQALLGAKHGRVLYMLYDELDEIPQLSQEINSLNKHYMKMVTFLYVKSLDTLIENISTLPDWKNIPSTIILDDLGAYCDANNLHNACGIVALLIDTARCCSMLLNTDSKLHISVSPSAVGVDYCNTLQDLYKT